MPKLTPAEQKVVDLDRKYSEVIKPYFTERREALEALAKETKVGHMFQDDEDVVYKVVEPTGTFVTFEKLAVDRTRRSDEKSGTLSLTKAREAGFTVEGV